MMRRAQPDESAVVLGVLDAVAARLTARGVVQWPPAFTAAELEPSLAEGRTWLREVDGEVLATLVLDDRDPLWSDGVPARYVHRLAVLRSGTGLGRRLLGWAGEQARAEGVDRLRLDCVAWNAPLRRFYVSAGFTHVDDIAFTGPPPDWALELDVDLDALRPYGLSRFERSC